MTELDDYLERLKACFADLPAAERAELIDDIAEHLTEVSAEIVSAEADSISSLADRLGPPERYAAELRAAAGLPSPGAATAFGRWKRRASAVDLRTGPVLGYARVSDFLRQLAPSWWVLRGYAAAAVVLWTVDGPSLVPTIAGNAWAGGLITAAVIVGSVWLGRRRPARAVAVRALAGAAQVAFVGLLFAATAQALAVFDRYDDPPPPPVVEQVVQPQDVPVTVVCRWPYLDTTERLALRADVCPPDVVVVPGWPTPSPSPS